MEEKREEELNEEETPESEEAEEVVEETSESEAEAETEPEREAESEGESEDEDDGESDEEKSNSFFKKKDKKENKIDELSDKLKRNLAEFENFRKRTEKEKSQMYDMGARSMLEKILPVVDNFERGLEGLDEDSDDPFADGMKMVYKQLMTALEQAGVTEIEALGCEFDPEIHNAVMHIDDEEYGENEIVEVMQKGYKYHDAVVRHSMVKVAN